MITIGLLWVINVTSKPREQISLPEKAVGYVVMPIQKLFNYIIIQINETYAFFYEVGAVKGEKERLSLRVQALEDEIRQLGDIKRENERLKQMLDLKDEFKGYTFENAQVIGRNPENWNNIILINKGTDDGIKINSEVISINKGLVGRIIEAAPDWAKVMLITDPNSSVSTIVDRTRDLAVVRGDGVATKYGYVRLNYILPEADIITEDIVVTSGFGGVFSKGILIGKVKEIKQEANELTKYAYVEPAADLNRLEEVLVIKSAPVQTSQAKEGKRP